MRRPTAQDIEHVASIVLPLTLGAAVFAVAFDHVRATATWAGQGGWYALVIASTGEVMAVSAMIEIRARRRAGTKVKFPVFVLVSSIAWSGACNLRAAAGLTGDPGAWRYIAALWVVVAFALVSGMKSTRTHAPVMVPVVEVAPVVPPVSEPSAPVDEVVPVPVEAPAPAPVVEPLDAPKPRASTPTRKPKPAGTAQRNPRSGSKKQRLAALINMVPDGDPRTDAELIREFAPMIQLDLGTARRYLADIRRAALADVVLADVAPVDEVADAPVPVAA